MHQLQKPRFGPRAAQLFNHTKTHPRAPVNGNTGGFVDGQQVLVFQKNRELACRRWHRRALGHPHGWHADHITHGHARIGLRTATVDAHFARSNDAVNMRFGHTFEHTKQKVVEPLAG